MSISFKNGNYSDIADVLRHDEQMPRTHTDELFALAEEHDGLLISKEARAAGIQDSVLVRLGQRGQLERMTKGVYPTLSIRHTGSLCTAEAVLWAKASQGPEHMTLSHALTPPRSSILLQLDLCFVR